MDEIEENQVMDKEEAIRDALIKNVIDECKEKGSPLPPSVMRLMNYFKGN